ncbi:hypothetical protein [Streptomyces sp. UH6]|uniref:hypothetical protein n=1 Tax=Streptomyces sp. UH6 TaxID=2748379 RepID=UPI0015D50FF4|nr:hypothetical protein [Streptomyces sp. UH6]NYV75747.1 hypothetical protein [Streptomyces sp. UH6]
MTQPAQGILGCMSDARQDLLNREAALDASVAALPLLDLPKRSLLTALYGVVYQLMHGTGKGSKSARPAEGEAFISRMSHLAPLIARCPDLPIGASAHDAHSPISADFIPQLRDLVQYGHACEIFPELWHGWFTVDGGDGVYVLDHPEGPIREAEELDILLSEISVPARLQVAPLSNSARTNILQEPGKTNGKDLILPALYYAIMETRELPLLYDGGMRAAVGVTMDEFLRFQRATAALACTWLDVAADAGRLAAKATRKSDRNKWLAEQMEWYAPLLSADYVEGMLASLTGLGESTLNKILDIFTLRGDGTPAGEGFFPPFTYFTDEVGRRMIMFSPDVLLHMTAQRNLVYVCSKRQRSTFDNLVSREMEPRLLDLAEMEFGRDRHLAIKRNVEWSHAGISGEFDLLVYDHRSNALMHLQAKAPIPPQGARMVKRLESRVEEGLEQLRRFRSLDEAGRNDVLSRIFGVTISGVEVHDVLLTRTGFGTSKVWQQLGDIIPANLQLLHGASEELYGATGVLELPRMANRLGTLLSELLANAKPRWKAGEITLGESGVEGRISITLPLLRLDPAAILKDRLILTPELP